MKLLKLLDERLEEMICVVVLAAMTAVIFIQIIIRFISPFIQLPMAWSEEIGRFLFIYAVYVGAALATRKRAHQKVDLLPLLVGRTGKYIFTMISELGIIVFAVAMTIYGWQVVENVAFVFVQTAPNTKLNMGIAYAGPAIGMTLCSFRAIQNMFKLTKQYMNEKKELSNGQGGEG